MRHLALVLVLLTGCDLYWSNHGDDVCNYGTGADLAPANELRNPYTGACESQGGYGCDDPCSPCPEVDTAGAPAIQPDWGQCYSQCNALTETQCFSTSGCLATYDDSSGTATFRGCFQTAPSGPISTGACMGLDAQTCSEHDNCAMYYTGGALPPNAGGGSGAGYPNSFERCAPEPSMNGCAGVDCGQGNHCEDQCKACPPNADCTSTNGQICNPMCVPDTDVCAAVDCGPGYQCVQVCVTPTPTHVGQCYGTCEAVTACSALTTEAACMARNDCTGVYDGMDCTCYPSSGCTCQILTYNHCETR